MHRHHAEEVIALRRENAHLQECNRSQQPKVQEETLSQGLSVCPRPLT